MIRNTEPEYLDRKIQCNSISGGGKKKKSELVIMRNIDFESNKRKEN